MASVSLSVQYSQLECTCKQAKYAQYFTLTAQAEPFDFLHILKLSMGYPEMYIMPGFGQSKTIVLKFAVTHHMSCSTMRLQKTPVMLECILKLG